MLFIYIKLSFKFFAQPVRCLAISLTIIALKFIITLVNNMALFPILGTPICASALFNGISKSQDTFCIDLWNVHTVKFLLKERKYLFPLVFFKRQQTSVDGTYFISQETNLIL